MKGYINRKLAGLSYINVILLFLFFTTSESLSQEKYRAFKVAIHLSSTVSGDRYSLEELAKILEENNIDVAVITDHFHVEVEYGLFPLRKIIRKRVSKPSIYQFGIKNYLQKIKAINEKSRVLLIPGAEVSPFYFWDGHLISKNLVLKNWHRHILVFGLFDEKDYKSLPTVSNNIPKYFKITNLGNLLYFILFILGGVLFKKPAYRKIRFNRQTYLLKNNKYKFTGIAVMLFTGLFLINNFPYFTPLYDPYHGDAGALPYQRLIDYVNERGGLAFWAHPEVNNVSKVNGVTLQTLSYANLLPQTENYTGFAIFWEGMKKLGRPGGLWDAMLKEYCSGVRQKPVWIIGELDFEDTTNKSLVREVSTIVFSKSRSVDAILTAMKHGRMYATRNFASDYLTLNEFSVSRGDELKVYMGQTLNSEIAPDINISLTSNKIASYRLLLIRDGKIIKQFKFDKSLEKKYVDKEISKSNRHFYRLLLLENNWPVLATNPIFVNFG